MAEIPTQSSPDHQYYERYRISNEQDILLSSPVRRRTSSKPIKPPTVTPKRFTKFFTPRSTQHILNTRQSKAGRQLRDITRNGINRRRDAVNPLSDDFLLGSCTGIENEHPSKRRKLVQEIASSPPLQSSPLKHVQRSVKDCIYEDESASPATIDLDELPSLLEDLKPFPKPIRRFRRDGSSRQVLERSFGEQNLSYRSSRRNPRPVRFESQTANFCSAPEDIHAYGGSALPFCAVTCNTNSLVAIGDEEGSVTLIDSSKQADFKKAHVKFRVHHNAVLDIAFNANDYILVTAGGDQTARIVDMHSQQTRCILSGHKSSIKRVQFQPNSDDIITSSGRDGAVMLWDLRVGGKSAVQSLRVCGRLDSDGNIEPETRYTNSRLNVGLAHASTTRPFSSDSELSITSFQHLPNGREHLILTASEVNATVKLWDIRNASRRSDALPLASTTLPETHQRTRNYGVNSMVLSTDGARLYTVCRDSTVYTYSTNHIALGHLPEMHPSSRRRYVRQPKTGLGPLYAFRHPSLRVGTFYVKAALRPATATNPEMLAVGSTDQAPVLFPTDESFLPARLRHDHAAYDEDEEDEEDEEDDLPMLSPPSSQHSSASSKSSTQQSHPVHEHGTALIRGHGKEVTSLTWTHDGDLVTVSDDFSARCWREDGEKARYLRGCGEGGGNRWGCGWAEVGVEWDGEEV